MVHPIFSRFVTRHPAAHGGVELAGTAERPDAASIGFRGTMLLSHGIEVWGAATMPYNYALYIT